MTQYYLKIFADLMEINSPDPLVMPDPYIENRSLASNVRMFYRLIRWSINTNDRIGALVNAYYLEYLLDERAFTPLERRKCRKIYQIIMLFLAQEYTSYLYLLESSNFTALNEHLL